MAKLIKGNVHLENLHFKEIPEILKDVSIYGSCFLSHNRFKLLNNCPIFVEFVYRFGAAFGQIRA